jgi:hypothetical protein
VPIYSVERLRVYGAVDDSLRGTTIDVAQRVYSIMVCAIEAPDAARLTVIAKGVAELNDIRGLLSITCEEYEDAIDAMDSLIVGYCREPYGVRCTWVAHACESCARERECAGWKAALMLRGVPSPLDAFTLRLQCFIRYGTFDVDLLTKVGERKS